MQISMIDSSIIIYEALRLAKSLIGIRELKPNRGHVIDEIQRQLGFNGVAYCVLFCLYCYKEACEKNNLDFPFLITASSQSLFEWANKKELIYTDPSLLKPGDIAIWRKFKLWQGHAGLIESHLIRNTNGGYSFHTIEGNTSNSNYGNQRDGDGIYRRIRYVNKIDFSVDGFYLRGFIDVKKLLT